MYKKALLLAVLVLAASAASIEGKAKKDIIAKVKAHYNIHRAKREPGTCVALECRDIGDECDPSTTACALPTGCRDSVCRTITAGDECDPVDECYNGENNLYCDYENNVCKAYDKVGDPCESECKYKYGEDPLVCDTATKTCKVERANPGEPCGSYTVCLEGSVCRYVSYDERICVIFPDTIDAECNTTIGCDSTKYLYCDSETSKCAELPKESEACESNECNKGFYCDYKDYTCKARKGLDEECSVYGYECQDGFTCADGKCRSENPKKGEYCSSKYYISCGNGYMCADNVCVEWDGTCEDDYECPGISGFCDNGKCKGNMDVVESERCVLDITEDLDYLYASSQCVEGLGCVPNAHGELEGTCKKITAKGGEVCESDDDCPADAFCSCNDKDGKMQCIPIPTSTKEFNEQVMKIENVESTCYEKLFESEEAYTKCFANEVRGFYDYIQDLYDYYSVYRCADISAIIGPTTSSSSSSSSSSSGDPSGDASVASSAKVSVVAMAAALLLALFF